MIIIPFLIIDMEEGQEDDNDITYYKSNNRDNKILHLHKKYRVKGQTSFILE